MNIRLIALGCSTVFLAPERTEPYGWYGAGSIMCENIVLGQDLPLDSQLCWSAGGRVA